MQPRIVRHDRLHLGRSNWQETADPEKRTTRPRLLLPAVDTITSGETWEGRFINQRKDGSLFTEEATISPLRNPTGEITGFVAIKRDIGEELVREEQLRQSQKMDSIGQLAGGIAHDFNNVLQAILGFSEILMMRLNEETVEYRNVTEINKAAKRAAELTKQLLTFSRKQPVSNTRIDLNDTISDTEVLVHVLLGENIKMEFDLAPDLRLLLADRGQMTQIIMNLAMNARDAMSNRGTLTIKTENIDVGPDTTHSYPEVPHGAYACLQISDTGHGMSAEVRDKLFEPFFTTKNVGEGTGLGLAVIYGIV